MSDLANTLREKSKLDDAMIVGSEIRAALQEQADELERLQTRVEALEGAIRRNPCLVLVAQDVPYRDCFPLGPCEPCHCGKDLIAAAEQECFACDGSGVEVTEHPDYGFVDTQCIVCNGRG